MKSEVKGTVRYEERGQGYRDVEKVGKHCSISTLAQEVPPKWWLLPTLLPAAITQISITLAVTYVP
jgi:hypothetical protein